MLGCLDHIVDAEVVMAGRYRWTLAHDEPEIIGYDQDLWVARLHPGDEDPAALVALFEPLRRGEHGAVGPDERRPTAPGSRSIANAARRASS